MLQSPDGEMTWGQEMQSALEDLVVLLKDEHTISSFELYNSGLVQTLLSILCNVSLGPFVWAWLFHLCSWGHLWTLLCILCCLICSAEVICGLHTLLLDFYS